MAIYLTGLTREIQQACQNTATFTFCARKLIVSFMSVLTRDLPARLRAHNDGRVNSTKERRPFELVYWEGCRNESDAAQREKYLKTAWGKRYIKNRHQHYLTG